MIIKWWQLQAPNAVGEGLSRSDASDLQFRFPDRNRRGACAPQTVNKQQHY
jgi:hypothetical protein